MTKGSGKRASVPLAVGLASVLVLSALAGAGTGRDAVAGGATDEADAEAVHLGPGQRSMVAECFAGIGSATIDVQGADSGRVEVLIVTAEGDTAGRHVNTQGEFRVAWLVLPGDCYRVLVTNQGSRAVMLRLGGDAELVQRASRPADSTGGRTS